MELMIQPTVVESQQLKVNVFKNMIIDMSAEEERSSFKERLIILCKDKDWPENVWQKNVINIFDKKIKITQQAVNKWFNAESLPNQEKKEILCAYFQCNYEWLCTGKGNKCKSENDDGEAFLKDTLGRTKETLSVAESDRLKEFLRLTPAQQIFALSIAKEEQTGHSEKSGNGGEGK